MQHVRLVPLTPAYRELFFEEELANYADEHVRDAGWEPETALEEARLKLGPVLERELAQVVVAKDRGHRSSFAWNVVAREPGAESLSRGALPAARRAS